MSATAHAANVHNMTNVSNTKTHKVNTIVVTLDSAQKYISATFPGPVKLGQTVRCHTDTVGGLVEIYFDVNGSPFRNLDGSAKTEIDSNDPPQELKVAGIFTGRCYMQTADGVVHTYNPAYPGAAGGNMDVS
jgi:hypothetical protein